MDNVTDKFLADNESALEIRENVYLSNGTIIGAYYKKSHIMQTRPLKPIEPLRAAYVPELPIFEDMSCSKDVFSELPDDALIQFRGSNSFHQEHFMAGQKLVLNGGTNSFTQCEAVRIIFAEGTTEATIISSASNLDFSYMTKDDVDKVKLTLFVTNGSIKLPNCQIPASWKIVASNAKIYAPRVSTATMFGLSASNCWIQAMNSIWLDRAENCAIYFDGATASKATLYGTTYIGNIIRSGSFDAQNATKTGVNFAAEICIGNRLDMANMNMTRSDDCIVCLGNYAGDGETVLNSADNLSVENIIAEID